MEPSVNGVLIALGDAAGESVASVLERPELDLEKVTSQTVVALLTETYIADVQDAEIWRYSADMLFLIEQPLIRDAFFPPNPRPYAIEAAKPREGAGIKSLLENVWGYGDYSGASNVVDTKIRSLRKKMKEYARMIETVSGMGYRFRRT